MVKEKKYDFTILFEKLEEASLANAANNEHEIEKQTYKEIEEHIRYLKEFYDVTDQDGYELLTRS